MVSTTDDSQPSRKAILYSFNYIWSSFPIGYRLVFKSLRTQQYSGSFIARCTNVGNLPRWSAGKNYLLKTPCRIAWPLFFDQPGNAAHISLSLDVAFELIQVRTGIEGLERLHRGGCPPVGTCESVAVEARNLLRRMKLERGMRATKKGKMLNLSKISSAKLARTKEMDLMISRDSYATQRRIEDDSLTKLRWWRHFLFILVLLPTSVALSFSALRAGIFATLFSITTEQQLNAVGNGFRFSIRARNDLKLWFSLQISKCFVIQVIHHGFRKAYEVLSWILVN